MASLCSTDVLTGQEGTLTFRPPGTSVCVRDHDPFGYDATATRIRLECGADFRVNDEIVFVEEDGGNLDTALTETPKADLPFGLISALGDLSDGVGYTDGTYTLPAIGGSGSGGQLQITVSSGQVTNVTVLKEGQGYEEGDVITADLPGGGTGFGIIVDAVKERVSPTPRAITKYYVRATGTEGGYPYITVATSKGGAAVEMNLDGGVTGAAGNIADLDGLAGGTGYEASQTFTSVPLTGGTGTGARAKIETNAAGVINNVTLTSGGSGYTDDDTLSVNDANVGGAGGSGFSVTVNGVDSNGRKDSDLPAHINITIADYLSVCEVREFSLEITRDELEVTTLPCAEEGDTDTCNRLAEFRRTQAGYATATGSATVYFSCDQETVASRLLQSSVLKSQQGARMRLYVCTKYKDGVLDNDNSLYVDADVAITGMSFSVNPDDPTSAEISFSVRKMNSVFGLDA